MCSSVWHITTWVLVTVTGATLLAAISTRLLPLVALAGIQAAGSAIVFIVTARRELGAAIRLPQWLLLGPLATGLLATTLTERPAAIAAGGLVALIGIAHLAWVFGGTFPARDRQQLAEHVIPSARLPGRVVTLLVTGVFFAMSASLLSAPRLVVLTIGAVFALRGLAGLGYGALRPSPKMFFVYDRILYSPGCLLIAGLAFSSAI